MRGTQPVLLFNNKKVLADAGLTPPRTWDELLAATKALKAKGVTPIALGGGDQWPTLMWFEYLYDRIGGPGLLQRAVGGDRAAWASEDSRKALAALKDLADSGAFGSNFDSVKFTDGGSPALVAKGKAAFELMGSWYYSTQQDANPDFAKSGLGYTGFPTLTGGKGDPADVVGNTNNFYSVLKKTKHPQAAADFLKLMYSDGVRQGSARRGQPAHHRQHRRLPRRRGQPRVLQVPVRPGQGRPLVPALLGPGLPAERVHPDAHRHPAVLRRQDRCRRLHQGHADLAHRQ